MFFQFIYTTILQPILRSYFWNYTICRLPQAGGIITLLQNTAYICCMDSKLTLFDGSGCINSYLIWKTHWAQAFYLGCYWLLFWGMSLGLHSSRLLFSLSKRLTIWRAVLTRYIFHHDSAGINWHLLAKFQYLSTVSFSRRTLPLSYSYFVVDRPQKLPLSPNIHPSPDQDEENMLNILDTKAHWANKQYANLKYTNIYSGMDTSWH